MTNTIIVDDLIVGPNMVRSWRAEIDTLKAEVENLTAERGHYKAGWEGCKADLEREREANAKLREALEAIASDRWFLGECQIDDFKGLDEKSIAKQALLAAKQDECKHDWISRAQWDATNKKSYLQKYCSKCGAEKGNG